MLQLAHFMTQVIGDAIQISLGGQISYCLRLFHSIDQSFSLLLDKASFLQDCNSFMSIESQYSHGFCSFCILLGEVLRIRTSLSTPAAR